MPLPANDYLSAMAENAWVRDWSEQWIQGWDKGQSDKIAYDNLTNIELNLSLAAPDSVLAMIVSITHQMSDGRHDPLLAAGLCEEFIFRYGETYIDVIEELAKLSPRFRHVLGGVWRPHVPDDVWSRIEIARGESW